MKIAEVKTHALRCHLGDDEVFGYSQAWFQSRASLIVEIITDDGITGWGEGFGPPEITKAVVDHAYKPLLMGRDPFDVDVIWQELYNTLRDHGQKGVVIEALSAVDIALWDISRSAGQPPSLTLLEPMLELDRTPNPLREETEGGLIQMEEGYIRVPTGPGLGIALDRSFISKYVVKSL